MITVNPDTKIGAILKAHPGALEAIISLSPLFEKLRNPFLRKILASQASVSMAAKIGNCSVSVFLARLEAIGFTVKTDVDSSTEICTKDVQPSTLMNINEYAIQDLDVRQIIQQKGNPLPIILSHLSNLKTGQALRVINSFEPVPLIKLMEKRGVQTFTRRISQNLFHTIFYIDAKQGKTNINHEKGLRNDDWDEIRASAGEIKVLDVRNMQMPQPMVSILSSLEDLKRGTMLYVYHKKVPVFLLPELEERSFEYRVREISDGEVHILIFKSQS